MVADAQKLRDMLNEPGSLADSGSVFDCASIEEQRAHLVRLYESSYRLAIGANSYAAAINALNGIGKTLGLVKDGEVNINNYQSIDRIPTDDEIEAEIVRRKAAGDGIDYGTVGQSDMAEPESQDC